MSSKTWSDLSPGTRRFIVIGGAFEAALKVAALVDLVPRPVDEIRGSKPRWAVAIVVTNSLGLVPISYFAFGRRRR